MATQTTSEVLIRPIDELDLDAVTRIDEALSGRYRPDDWERRIMYYMRRDPEGSLVAEVDGEVVGFMLGEVRSGEFGLEEPTGWIEVLGVDPEQQGRAIGKQLLDGMLAGFRERKATTVRTLVDEESMAPIAAFFTRAGFRPAPIRAFERDLG